MGLDHRDRMPAPKNAHEVSTTVQKALDPLRQ